MPIAFKVYSGRHIETTPRTKVTERAVFFPNFSVQKILTKVKINQQERASFEWWAFRNL